METLDGTPWDVLIVGTGIQQSLLALALSRSGKQILHLDENSYYGGSEAAFSIQEAEEWADTLNHSAQPSPFRHAALFRPDQESTDGRPKLSSGRSYSIALAPNLIQTRSALLNALVTSQVYRQLEFLAVGSWWLYSLEGGTTTKDSLQGHDNAQADEQSIPKTRLVKIPNGREDIFTEQGLDFKSKRVLMRFLRFIVDYEEQVELWDSFRQQPFSTFLTEKFNVPISLHSTFLALTLSPLTLDQTTTEFALGRIATHLRSMGMFGPGFGAVVPKWGGLCEITQVACRANAVGGGVYVLGKGLQSYQVVSQSQEAGAPDQEEAAPITALLTGGEKVTTKWLVTPNELPEQTDLTDNSNPSVVSRSITIVSSSLKSLFPSLAEGSPMPAGAVVVFPSELLDDQDSTGNGQSLPWVYVLVHSSDTGECPSGQCVLYASVATDRERGYSMLDEAIQNLLNSFNEDPSLLVLWNIKYEQHGNILPSTASTTHSDGTSPVIKVPRVALDLVFDDSVLDSVKSVWERIIGDDDATFLGFETREDVELEMDEI